MKKIASWVLAFTLVCSVLFAVPFTAHAHEDFSSQASEVLPILVRWNTVVSNLCVGESFQLVAEILPVGATETSLT